MPPDVEECKKWINAARPLLGFSVTKPNMIKRNEEVAGLLKSMEDIIKDDVKDKPPKFPVLKTQQQFAVFQNSYKDLAGKFEGLAKEADAINKGGNGDIQAVSQGLRKLKQEARLELGKAKPTANKKVEKQLLEAARFQPIYEDTKKSVTAALNRLKRTPGTQTQQQELQQLLNAGAAALPDYYSAVLAMTLWADLEVGQGTGVRRIVQDAYKDADALPEKVIGKEFATKVDDAYSKLSTYEAKAAISQPDVVDGFYAELHKLHRDIEGPNVDKKKAGETLDDIMTRLDAADKACERERIAVETPKALLGTKWNDLEKTVPTARFSVLKAEKEAAESLESCQLYQQTEKAYRALLKKVDTALEATAQAPAQWQNLQTQISYIEKTLATAEGIPQLSSVASELRSTILKARQEVSVHQDFKTANDLIEGIKKDAQALEKAAKSLANNAATVPPTVEFPDPSRTVEVKLNGLASIVNDAIVKVKKDQISQLADEKGHIEPLLKQCDAIANGLPAKIDKLQKDFERVYGKARPKKKEATLNTFLKRIETECSDLVKQVDAIGRQVQTILGDPTKTKESQLFANLAKNQAKSAEAIKTARATLSRLDDLHLPAKDARLTVIAKQRNALDNIKDDAKQGRDVEKQLGAIQKALDDQLAVIQEEIDLRKKNAVARMQALTSKIDKLEKGNQAYKGSFAKLRTDVAIAGSKFSSPVFAISDKGAADLDTLDTRIDALKDTLEDDAKNYKAVEKKLKELGKQVEELKEYNPQAHARLQHKVATDLPPKVQTLLPDEALSVLDKFETGELEKAKQKTAELKQKMVEFAVAAATTKKLLKDAKLEKAYPALQRSLEKRLDDARASTVDQLAFGKNELSAIELMINAAANDKVKAGKLDTNAEEDEFDEKRRQAEYWAAAELFETNFRNEARNIGKASREDEYKQMQYFVKQANKLATQKPPNFVAARENLQRATEMAKFVIENAQDDTSPRGRNLKKLNASWKNRVSVYLKDVSDLIAAVEESQVPTGAKDIDRPQVTKALEPLLSFFDPAVFDKYVKELSASPETDSDLQKHRALKEQALVRVRKFNAKLTDNQVLKHVARNTISKVTLKPLKDTLLGLEAELQGA